MSKHILVNSPVCNLMTIILGVLYLLQRTDRCGEAGSWKVYFAIILYERTTKIAWLPSHFTGG